MSQHYVDPNKVFVGRATEWGTRSLMAILKSQGQIEPIIARKVNKLSANDIVRQVIDDTLEPRYEFSLDDRSYEEYPFAGDLVMAARRLAWPTILVETEVRTSG